MSIKTIEILVFPQKMAISRCDSEDAQSTIDNRFTTKTTIYLYEVNSLGHRVTCDMWYEEQFDHWSKEHGLFANKVVAERRREEVADALVHQGYVRAPSGLFHQGYHDACVKINTIEIDPADIAVDGKGNCSYKGREVAF